MRPGHSIETALLAIRNDLLLAADRRWGCVMLQLDLSAAFDTVDHHTILRRLYTDFGVAGLALEWFKSYLTGRSQSATVQGASSSRAWLQHVVPQGSVVGPVLYIIYVNRLREVVAAHGVKIMQYSDDTSIRLEFPPTVTGLIEALDILSACAGDLFDWFSFNWLRPNPSKSEWQCFMKDNPPVSPPPPTAAVSWRT